MHREKEKKGREHPIISPPKRGDSVRRELLVGSGHSFKSARGGEARGATEGAGNWKREERGKGKDQCSLCGGERIGSGDGSWGRVNQEKNFGRASRHWQQIEIEKRKPAQRPLP